jgi:hypothetical protein
MPRYRVDTYDWRPIVRRMAFRMPWCGCCFKGEAMFLKVMRAFKWAAIPVLLIASPFSCFAANYQPLLDCLVCMGAVFFIQRAVWLKAYAWAAGTVAVVVVFSPLFLLTKIFLIMGLSCVASIGVVLTNWRLEPLAAL